MADSGISKSADSQEEKIHSFQRLIAENEEALKQLMAIMKELRETDHLLETDFVKPQPKEEITEKAPNPFDREQKTRLIHSLTAGLAEANQHMEEDSKVKIFDLLQALDDPDVNRAIRYLIYFLKGLGKELQEN
jgi:uncharacterized protein YjgD (DUF1641 family)